MKRLQKIITVSQEFVNEVVERTKIPNEKIVLVPNTVHQSFYKEASVNQKILDRFKDQFVLLYLGDTALRRGVQTAIAALDILKITIPNIKLVVVGRSTTDPILKEQVSNLKLNDYVDFEGWQNVELFPSYIMASSICISPLERKKYAARCGLCKQNISIYEFREACFSK